jgi:hypothetical protein
LSYKEEVDKDLKTVNFDEISLEDFASYSFKAKGNNTILDIQGEFFR